MTINIPNFYVCTQAPHGLNDNHRLSNYVGLKMSYVCRDVMKSNTYLMTDADAEGAAVIPLFGTYIILSKSKNIEA